MTIPYRQPEVRVAYQTRIAGAIDQVTRLLREVLQAEQMSTRGARTLALGVIAAIEGSVQLGAAAPGVVPRGFAAPAVRAMVRGMIASRPRSDVDREAGRR